MNEKTFQRKKYSCPKCSSLIDESYIEMNPFPEIPCPSCAAVLNVESLTRVVLEARDERTDPRCPMSLKVSYQSFNEFITEYTKNVSKGGMYIATSRQHKLHEIVELSIHVPGIADPLRITGEVVRLNTKGDRDEEAGIGIKFIGMDNTSRHILVTYISSHRGCS